MPASKEEIYKALPRIKSKEMFETFWFRKWPIDGAENRIHTIDDIKL